MELGARIEAWLKAKGRTRRELADFCGVTLSAVCLWFGKGKNHSPPSRANEKKILEFFGLTTVEFYGPVPKAPKKKAAPAKRAVA